MANIDIINSDIYWDARFAENWDVCEGPRQSRFFARIAIDHLPQWLLEELKRHSLTLVDWGCAQGDGTDVWASYIDAKQIAGVDFSSVAIEQAAQRYPAIRFINADWLTPEGKPGEVFDVVFSSNTLEHFHKPYDALNAICRRAKKAIVLALPYKEFERIDEHFFSFLPENIPLQLVNGFKLIWSRVVDCRSLPNTLWNGDQVILVYADSNWVNSLGLKLRDYHIEQSDTATEIARLNIIMAERDGQIANLNQAVSELDGQIASLNQAVVERDGQIASLNQAVVERDGQIASLNQAVVERDGQIASLNQAVVERDEQITSLNDIAHSKGVEVFKLRSSTSWKLTRPLRFIKFFFHNPKKSVYDLAKFVFWSLPSPIRHSLQEPRYRFVRWVRESTVPKSNFDQKNNRSANDLSWEEFSAQVLVNRSNYKGVFIQELNCDWSIALFQRPQHISAAFGRLGYLAIYKTYEWGSDSLNEFRQVAPNVWLSSCSEVNQIENAVHSIYSTAFNFHFETFTQIVNKGITIYEYIDHIDPQISGSENIDKLTSLKNWAFSGGADFIVASARMLEAEAVEVLGRDKVILAQNGVDTRHYRNPIHQSTPLPENLTAFRKKYSNIVGYFGALAPWLWYEAISELVEARSDLGFVFIGPDYLGGLANLPKADNLLYLGIVDYTILPAYARQFDVCFIPFAPGEIARTTSPLKLFEYFALEKPVVATSEMQECLAFKEVFSGDSASTLSDALDAAIGVKEDPSFKARLSQLADENDWDQRARAMATVFKKNVGVDYLSSLLIE